MSDTIMTLKAAMSYAELGLRVFPVHGIMDAGECACGKPNCESPGKRPLTPDGFKSATTSWRDLPGSSGVAIYKGGNMEQRLMNVKELAVYLSMPVPTVYTMVSLKKLPGVIRLGRSLRFEKNVIDAWVNAKAEAQTNAQ